MPACVYLFSLKPCSFRRESLQSVQYCTEIDTRDIQIQIFTSFSNHKTYFCDSFVNEVVFLLSVRHPTLSNKNIFDVPPSNNTSKFNSLPFYNMGTTENLFVLAIIETDQWNSLIVWVKTSCLQTSEKKGGTKKVIPYVYRVRRKVIVEYNTR